MSAVIKDSMPLIRKMRQADVAAVAEIEKATYEYPWTSGIFRDCLLAGYINLVLDDHGETVGYGIMSIAAGEAHLLNICVRQELRQQGIGGQFLGYMLRQAREASVDRIYLEVRPSNKSAIRLYERNGFVMLGVRENYYKASNGKEDAVVLVQHFPKSSPVGPGD